MTTLVDNKAVQAVLKVLPRLRTLNLSLCRNIRDRLFEGNDADLDVYPNLQEINVGWCNALGRDAPRQICQVFPGLRSFKLQNLAMKRESFPETSTFPNIVELDLRDSPVGNDYDKSLKLK